MADEKDDSDKLQRFEGLAAEYLSHLLIALGVGLVIGGVAGFFIARLIH